MFIEKYHNKKRDNSVGVSCLLKISQHKKKQLRRCVMFIEKYHNTKRDNSVGVSCLLKILQHKKKQLRRSVMLIENITTQKETTPLECLVY